MSDSEEVVEELRRMSAWGWEALLIKAASKIESLEDDIERWRVDRDVRAEQKSELIAEIERLKIHMASARQERDDLNAECDRLGGDLEGLRGDLRLVAGWAINPNTEGNLHLQRGSPVYKCLAPWAPDDQIKSDPMSYDVE